MKWLPIRANHIIGLWSVTVKGGEGVKCQHQWCETVLIWCTGDRQRLLERVAFFSGGAWPPLTFSKHCCPTQWPTDTASERTRVTEERGGRVPKSHKTFGRGGGEAKENKPKAVEANESRKTRGLGGRNVKEFKKGRLSEKTEYTKWRVNMNGYGEEKDEHEESLRWTIHPTFYSLFSAY